MKVYLDSTPEHLVPELALDVARIIEGGWNGWLRPLATRTNFESFIKRWRRNDPKAYGVGS